MWFLLSDRLHCTFFTRHEIGRHVFLCDQSIWAFLETFCVTSDAHFRNELELVTIKKWVCFVIFMWCISSNMNHWMHISLHILFLSKLMIWNIPIYISPRYGYSFPYLINKIKVNGNPYPQKHRLKFQCCVGILKWSRFDWNPSSQTCWDESVTKP